MDFNNKETLEKYMEQALLLAEKAASLGEVPVGAIVVSKDTGKIIGSGYNRCEKDKSPLAHAEIIAINEAAKNLGGWRLINSALFVTLEPCIMCSGAIINARIENLIFGAYDFNASTKCSTWNIFERPCIYKPDVSGGILEDKCSAILKDFFKKLRKSKKPSLFLK